MKNTYPKVRKTARYYSPAEKVQIVDEFIALGDDFAARRAYAKKKGLSSGTIPAWARAMTDPTRPMIDVTKDLLKPAMYVPKEQKIQYAIKYRRSPPSERAKMAEDLNLPQVRLSAWYLRYRLEIEAILANNPSYPNMPSQSETASRKNHHSTGKIVKRKSPVVPPRDKKLEIAQRYSAGTVEERNAICKEFQIVNGTAAKYARDAGFKCGRAETDRVRAYRLAKEQARAKKQPVVVTPMAPLVDRANAAITERMQRLRDLKTAKKATAAPEAPKAPEPYARAVYNQLLNKVVLSALSRGVITEEEANQLLG